MKQFTAKELSQAGVQNFQGIQFTLKSLVVPAISEPWLKVTEKTFKNPNIVITRLNPRTANTTTMYYLDESTREPAYIVIPNDFVFKSKKIQSKKLIEKYKNWLLSDLQYNCHYNGGRVGSDPEIFAEDKAGTIIPAFNFLGSKKKPSLGPARNDHPEGMNKNDIYWDGFQGEFTTHAFDCMGWHADSIQAGLQGLWTHLQKHNPDAKLSAKTVMDIPPDMLKNALEEHVEFGCSPSYNIYGMKGLKEHGRKVDHRAAGGHIHFGCGTLSKDELERVVKALDAILGVACVSLFEKYDDPRRRQMYGLAGEYRLPPHGLEYRTLSNAWLFHPVLANLVFDLARSAYAMGWNDFLKYWDGSEKETVDVINNCDVKGARKILKKNKELFTEILNIRYRDRKMSKVVFDWILGGADTFIKDMSDIVGNWDLDGVWTYHSDGTNKTARQAYISWTRGTKKF